MPPPHWIQLTDTELLEQRICDLHLDIVDSPVWPYIQQLHQELADKGLHFRPTCYFADEWFVPVDVPVIGVPFYLAHARLQKLEHAMIYEVEGGDPKECMQLLRHEAGHAIMYAYQLNRRHRFRTHFGKSSEPYEDTYQPQPFSRKYVMHLKQWYAQAHPDEDFAETFAVWLTPDRDWRSRYAKWPALAKLEAMDAMMGSIAGKSPTNTARKKPLSAHTLKRKLSTHYHRKRVEYAEDFPQYFDKELRQLFSETKSPTHHHTANHWLRSHSKTLIQVIASTTGCRKYRVTELLTKFRTRSQALALYANPKDTQLLFKVGTVLTTSLVNYLHTGMFKRNR